MAEAQANIVPAVTGGTWHVPCGVVVAITLWNSLRMALAWKLGPAQAAGNNVVFKLSELTSASTLELGGKSP